MLLSLHHTLFYVRSKPLRRYFSIAIIRPVGQGVTLFILGVTEYNASPPPTPVRTYDSIFLARKLQPYVRSSSTLFRRIASM